MRKRHGETLVEVLIAFVIIIIAIAITVLPSRAVNQLKKESVIKSHIYDLAYSYAEQQMSTSVLLFKASGGSTEVKINDSDYRYPLIFTITIIPTKTTFLENATITITEATLSVAYKGEENDYKVEMLLFPKQN
ncbi:MAG TPA: prepilin-type N-terminal cleavage/methylation domain-containing protein [Thermotogota bacterium]|nr:prepilin-type N-terminal cleavage/methylation domain-containing protein [Thermotogota bacterium]HPR95137.1 prepilin-type N-terminal cleavage/methylation domain-containing protein [Thermotogota bacterium]